MAAYVIKSWKAQEQPLDNADTYVQIEGRAAGLFSWLLSQLKISPTVSLAVTANEIAFESGSLEGRMKYLTALANISSTFYGYRKPWREAVILGALVGFFTFFLLGIPGIILGVLYYFLNHTLTIGYVELSGVGHGIDFKRSVIEGQNIDEAAAQKVCVIIQRLVDARRQARTSAA